MTFFAISLTIIDNMKMQIHPWLASSVKISSSFLAISTFFRSILGKLFNRLDPPILAKALHFSGLPMINSKMHSRQRSTSSQQSSQTFLLRTRSLAQSESRVRKLRASRRSWQGSYLLRNSKNFKFSSLVFTSFWKMRILLAFSRHTPKILKDSLTQKLSSLQRLKTDNMESATSICLNSAAKVQPIAREDRVSSSCSICSRWEGSRSWSWVKERRRGQRRSMIGVCARQFSRLVMTCLQSMARQQMALFWIMQKLSFSNPSRQQSASKSSSLHGVIRMPLHSRVKMFFITPTSSRYLQAQCPEDIREEISSSLASLLSIQLRTRKCLLKQISFLFSVLAARARISPKFLLLRVDSIANMFDVLMFLCVRCSVNYCSVIDFIHLCYSNYPAVALRSGNFSKHLSRKSMQSGEPFLGNGGF